MMMDLSHLDDNQKKYLAQLLYDNGVLNTAYSEKTLSEIVTMKDVDKFAQEAIQSYCEFGLGGLKIKEIQNDPIVNYGSISFKDTIADNGLAYKRMEYISMKNNKKQIKTVPTEETSNMVYMEDLIADNRKAFVNEALHKHSTVENLSEAISDINNANLKENGKISSNTATTSVSLSNLTDEQNMLLTQLSYASHVLVDKGNGITLDELNQSEITEEKVRNIIKELCAAGLGSIRIKDVNNDKVSGFGAVAFTDDSGNVGFSFRGTDGIKIESINDWLDNVESAFFGTSGQITQSEAFFDKNRDTSGNNYLYGHSKGGNLSESVYVNNYSDIKGVHLLNPQPLNPYSLTPDQLLAIQSEKVDIVIIEGDYVWFLGTLPSYENIRIAEGNGTNPHLYDAIRNMYDGSGTIIPGKMPGWEYVAYFGISKVITSFQYFGGKVGLVYNCVVRVVDYVKNDLIPKAKEFIVHVVDEIKKFGNDIKDFVDNLREFLINTINNVKEWYNKNLNVGYKFSYANPEIKVDTYKLKNYAQRLQSINRRISNLDKRLDSLYWRVGLLDLWNLIQADALTGYSWRINRCISYLNETAVDFENVESNLLNNL